MFVVVFEVEPHATSVQQYLDFGKLLRPELEQIDGFIDNERFASEDTNGRVLSLSTWRNEKALIRWRTHAQHHNVQQQGRDEVFAGYRLQIGEVTSDSATPTDLPPQQRFDETETGAAKALILLEFMPSAAHNEQLRMLTQTLPSGLIHAEVFNSLYQPDKRVLLTYWAESAAAHTWYASAIEPLQDASLRSRVVRIIRSYGMNDRAEAPQYYPPVKPTK